MSLVFYSLFFISSSDRGKARRVFGLIDPGFVGGYF